MSPQGSVALVIACRFLKATRLLISLIIFIVTVAGGYSVYLLWGINPLSLEAQHEVQAKLEIGWLTVGAIAVLGLLDMALNWIFLAPMEARVKGVDLHNPEVAAEKFTEALGVFFAWICGIAFYLAVPASIAYIRFGHF